MKSFFAPLLLGSIFLSPMLLQAQNQTAAANVSPAVSSSTPIVKVSNGALAGTYNNATGIDRFAGIPFAAPPVGNLRWKEPQPAANWSGTKKADKFAHMPMQKKIYDDMIFRADTISEDCLYLNVWAPANSAGKKLPVLVYFYGGGFTAGDGSEYRYDGESIAQKGIIAITISYRLGVFGFLSLPELSQESPHHASGNYGLLDQSAALQWVQKNIAAFGGDPSKVTIAGESAGSISVAAQMASPLSKNLIAGAIGESGAMLKPTIPAVPLAEGEKLGLAFAEKAGAKTLAELRALTAAQLLELSSQPGAFRVTPTIDGYFFPKSLLEIFAAGEQAHVPLLAGWNSAEIPYQAFTGGDMPTPENYAAKVKQQYPADADEVLKLYPGTTQDEVIKSATALASDRFIAYSTWKWADLQSKTGYKPVYRYLFAHPRPKTEADNKNAVASKMPAQMVGASHASEIEFALGNLHYDKVYPWTSNDYTVSGVMENYFANFIKTGNPNGKGLPKWDANTKGSTVNYMLIDTNTHQQAESDRARYLFLDKQYSSK